MTVGSAKGFEAEPAPSSPLFALSPPLTSSPPPSPSRPLALEQRQRQPRRRFRANGIIGRGIRHGVRKADAALFGPSGRSEERGERGQEQEQR